MIEAMAPDSLETFEAFREAIVNKIVKYEVREARALWPLTP